MIAFDRTLPPVGIAARNLDVAAERAEFPDFEQAVRYLCKHG